LASENPQDRAALDRLIRQLGGVQAELERQLGAAREEQAAAASDRKAA
jgi:phage host-nuclease inhibitor protein Gam